MTNIQKYSQPFPHIFKNIHNHLHIFQSIHITKSSHSHQSHWSYNYFRSIHIMTKALYTCNMLTYSEETYRPGLCSRCSHQQINVPVHCTCDSDRGWQGQHPSKSAIVDQRLPLVEGAEPHTEPTCVSSMGTDHLCSQYRQARCVYRQPHADGTGTRSRMPKFRRTICSL